MSAPVIAPVEAAKVPKPKAVKPVASHPSYATMIRNSVSELREKSGSSKTAILKYMLAHYNLGENVAKINSRLRLAIKRAVIKGDIKQVKGSGASGSFKLGEKKATTPTAKKSITKKPKSAKKGAAAKKPKTEKKANSPKKVMTPKVRSAMKPTAKTTKPIASKSVVSKPKVTKKVKA